MAASCLFCLEVFVDTVDFTADAAGKAAAAEAAANLLLDFAFIFPGGYPPLIIRPPDVEAFPHMAAWVKTRAGKLRLRCTYQTGKSALFEANPVEVSASMSTQPMQTLALQPEPKDSKARRRTLAGTGGIHLSDFRPPGVGGWERLGGRGSGSWGCVERAVAINDSLNQTVAVALVVVSLAAVNPALKAAVITPPSGRGRHDGDGYSDSPRSYSEGGSDGDVFGTPRRGYEGAAAPLGLGLGREPAPRATQAAAAAVVPHLDIPVRHPATATAVAASGASPAAAGAGGRVDSALTSATSGRGTLSIEWAAGAFCRTAPRLLRRRAPLVCGGRGLLDARCLSRRLFTAAGRRSLAGRRRQRSAAGERRRMRLRRQLWRSRQRWTQQRWPGQRQRQRQQR